MGCQYETHGGEAKVTRVTGAPRVWIDRHAQALSAKQVM
jgi:hypothetical protein